MLPDRTAALVELAVTSGLPLMGDRLAPLTATTRGTGEIIARALDDGASGLWSVSGARPPRTAVPGC